MSIPEQITLKARWGERKESIEGCAAKLHGFLLQLAECDELFARGWLKCSGTLQSNVEPLSLFVGELRKILEKGRSRRDQDKSVIEELGFRSGRLWNGSETEPAHVSVQCGAYPDPRVLPASNYVWVELPNEGSAATRLLRPDNLSHLMRIVVENWNPDWARISTNKIDAEIYQENPYVGQRVGWLTYISSRYGQLPKLPQECVVTRLGELGNLVVVASISGLSASRSENVKAIRQLSEILKKAGKLAPIPPTK